MSDQPAVTEESSPASTGTEESSPKPIEAAESKPKPIGPTIDAISKAAALCIALIYVSGFLIASLNDFRYGFSVMNPLRPRILAAGGWFFLFLAVPVELIRLLLRHPLWKRSDDGWYKIGALILQYYYSAIFIASPAGMFVFVYDGHGSTPRPWLAYVIYVVLLAVGLFFLSFQRTPKAVRTVLVYAVFLLSLWGALDPVIVRHEIGFGAVELWLLGVGGWTLLEMKVRSSKPKRDDWTNSIYLFALALTIFANAYYPHIKASLGGGATIPIQITFTKDFPMMPNQTVVCMLIDETDSGFYVIGKDEKHATFIPRSAVTLIHFADASESSIFTPKAK
ncbi:MAG TPA: hypothetical protein VMD29_06785 [Terracidiphilus sp.]|nr:hypothetical protein [Terracidiphilus sp.]